MKILLLKPSSLGDVVQALPVARLLKRKFPDAEIHWWLNRELVPLLAGDRDLTRVIPFDRRAWASLAGLANGWRGLRALRRERYDWVIDLQSLARSALVGWLARGKRTIGLDDRREGAPLLYDLAVPRPSYRTHAVDWYLEVLRRLDVPVDFNFEWFPVRPAVAATVAAQAPDPDAVWIALQPGARWDNKRWPVAHFAELAARLVAHHPRWQVVILGGIGDQALGTVIQTRVGKRGLDLTGRLSLPEMVEWLRRCSLMVTNDTGPMHVAAALGKPVVALFGPTEPTRTGPYRQVDQVLRLDLPCAPCMKPVCRHTEPLACLQRLTPEQVFTAVITRLANTVPPLALPRPLPKLQP